MIVSLRKCSNASDEKEKKIICKSIVSKPRNEAKLLNANEYVRKTVSMKALKRKGAI